MKVYKHRVFLKWAKDEGLDDHLLKEMINEIEVGLFEANLGSGLYKKRIAKKGFGKSSGYRTLIAFKQDDKAILMFGFAKNNRENITDAELMSLKKLAQYYLPAIPAVIQNAIKIGELIEVIYE